MLIILTIRNLKLSGTHAVFVIRHKFKLSLAPFCCLLCFFMNTFCQGTKFKGILLYEKSFVNIWDANLLSLSVLVNSRCYNINRVFSSQIREGSQFPQCKQSHCYVATLVFTACHKISLKYHTNELICKVFVIQSIPAFCSFTGSLVLACS